MGNFAPFSLADAYTKAAYVRQARQQEHSALAKAERDQRLRMSLAGAVGQDGNVDWNRAAGAALKEADTDTLAAIASFHRAMNDGSGTPFYGGIQWDRQDRPWLLRKDGTLVQPTNAADVGIVPPVQQEIGIDETTGQPVTRWRTRGGAVRGGAGGAPGGGGATPRAPLKPLPKEAQEDLTSITTLYRALNDMEEGLGTTGVGPAGIGGYVRGKLGTDPKAVKFDTARKNFAVISQSLIKGIPSNYDAQTFMATIADRFSSQPVNKSLIKFTREITDDLLRDTLAYHKGTGVAIPQHFVQLAKTRGIDINQLNAWRGGDPFEATAKKYKIPQIGEKAAAEVAAQPGQSAPASKMSDDEIRKALGL